MPSWLMLVLAVAAAIAVVVLVVVLRDRRTHAEEIDPDETPDVIEYMTMMIGVVYAIVLGLAIAGVWEARSGADETVRREVHALHAVSERAGVWPEPVRTELRSAVDEYVRYATGDEWDTMVDSETLTPHGDRLMARINGIVSGYNPRTDAENRAAYTLADQAAAAEEARSDRSLDLGPTMPTLVWFGLIAGAMVAIGMLFALQIRRSPRELILAGIHSALLAFLLYLVWDFDTPYVHAAEDLREPFTSLFPGSVT
ncbi:hypothetical protein SRB5_35940 [Streptomyces sp. RB5]|uniref:DUF4239 domain-containing protein n=1 Tax=Streptomyces smaragdinus TaxID=2585196 RepID=A0A7K0CJ19_9ACTN|nr:DUF4239 domain-containing protein [Streptomyces smaragdinus]MQY13446.1 hypothetical protein [Streptomyces smaragdinus]